MNQLPPWFLVAEPPRPRPVYDIPPVIVTPPRWARLRGLAAWTTRRVFSTDAAAPPAEIGTAHLTACASLQHNHP